MMTETKRGSKNIIVCLDGTGNQIEANISNVLKMYRALDKNGTRKQHQTVYYHPGVGTIGLRRPWSPVTEAVRKVLGLATGYGLDRQILAAYRFIVQNYHQHTISETVKRDDGTTKTVQQTIRDRIYIFGYSRGAYAARALAGLIETHGVLHPNQLHFAPAALETYKTGNVKKRRAAVDEFNRVTQAEFPGVSFLGLFDTVGSFIVPRRDRFFLPSLMPLPLTQSNPGVNAMFEASSIDENRRMFRLELWERGQTFRREHYSTKTQDQVFKRVWFAGHHGDIGGGNSRAESGLSQYPLIWMAEQAKNNGVVFITKTLNYVTGRKPPSDQTRYLYPTADISAPAHASGGLWAMLEWLPKRHIRSEGNGRFRKGFFGLYFPRWEPRFIPEAASIHISAVKRVEVTDYSPGNLPKKFVTVGELPS